MKIIWSEIALDDYDDQIEYIRKRNPRAALEQDDLVDAQVAALTEYPEKGRSGRKAGTRELVINGTPFIAVYRIRPRHTSIEILRLLHGAQKWPRRRRKT